MIPNLHLPIPCLSVCVSACVCMHMHSQACMHVHVYKCIHACGSRWSASPCFRDKVSRWPGTHKVGWLAIDSRDLPSSPLWCCDHKHVPPPLEFSQGSGEIKLRTSQLSERTSLTKPSHIPNSLSRSRHHQGVPPSFHRAQTPRSPLPRLLILPLFPFLLFPL